MSYKTLSSDKVSTIVNRMGIYMPTQELEAFVNTMDDVAGANKDEVEDLVVRAENSAMAAQQDADTAFASAQVATNAANAARDSADQSAVEAQNKVSEMFGLQNPVPFASGITVSTPTITVIHGGATYAPVDDALPFTTTSTFNPAQWRVVQGVTTADLGAESGAAMIGVSIPGLDSPITVATAIERIHGYATGFRPLTGVVTDNDAAVVVIASRLRDGYVYGRHRDTGALCRSTDGVTWTELSSVGTSQIILLIPAGDGEVLAACGSAGIRKSSGWATNPATATWPVVLSSANSDFLSWGLDSDGAGLCVATHYNADDYTQSRYVWKSVDSGVTWTPIRDLGASTRVHLHFVRLDPWANNRIWISYHREYSQGLERAIEYSDDGGSTWVELSDKWQPTTCVATPNGMVMGTDDGPGGILHVRRTADPAQMSVELAAPFPVEQSPFAWVFAVYAEYDETTGIAYTGFISQVNGTPAGIFASDGNIAGELYRTGPQPNTAGFREFAFCGDEIIWRTNLSDGVEQKQANTWTRKALRGQGSPLEFDRGRVLGGRVTGEDPFRSVAVGPYAVAGVGWDATAIGNKARAGHSIVSAHGATAIGAEADARNAGSTAVGHRAVAEIHSIAVGRDATTGANAAAVGHMASAGASATSLGAGAVANESSVSIGRNAANNAPASAYYTAIGQNTKAESYAQAIGHAATATALGTTAIGRSATATSQYGVAIGHQAQAAFQYSVALGAGSVASAANQVQVGPRHTESAALSADPPAPTAGNARTFFRTNGSGKMEFCVRFPTGTTQVIATEA